jgi:hypothetical protein
MVFVACAPSCVFGWHSQPARLGPVRQPPRPTGPFAPKGLCRPSHPRYYDPIRQSRQLLLISQERWLYRRPSPDNLVWAAAETFPALGQHSFHACRHLYAGRRSRSISPMSPCSHRLPQQNSESAPPTSRHRLRSGPISRRCPCSLCYGPRGCSPSWTDPTWRFPSGRRGLPTRAFPREGHPPRESGIATRHPGRTP